MSYTQQMLDSLRKLVSIDSVQSEPLPNAPFGKGVRQALDCTLELCRNLGYTVKDIDGYCAWAEIGQGELFGILCHIDTVPLGEGWKHSPLSGEVFDGEIYGRGVVDDKGPLINALYAARALLDEGKLPKKRIRFIIGCNEETDWHCIERYLLTEEIPTQAISPDGDYPVINCEKALGHFELDLPRPECLNALTAGERVNMVPDKAVCEISKISDVTAMYAINHGIKTTNVDGKWILEAQGRSAHGSTPYLGENALVKILQTIAALDPTLNNLAKSLSAWDGSGCGLDLRDEASGGLTMTVGYGKTEGERLKIGLDIRFPISYTHETIFDKLKEAFPYAEVVLIHAHPSLYFPKDHPFVRTLLDAYVSVTHDRNAKPQTIGGATYARAIPNTLAFGPVFPNRENLCHQVDERVSLEDFENNFLILKEALDRLCF